MISWFSEKKTSVELGTNEAEYIVVCSASKKVAWLQNMFAIFFDLELEENCI
jgi:hypothetical protein